MKFGFYSLLTTIFSIILINVAISQTFWQDTNGPNSNATVKDFLYYNTDTIFIATSEGIIRSIDNGTNWGRIAGAEYSIACLTKDITGILYAGAKDIYDNTYLLRSTNRGSSWFQMNTGFYADIREILIPFQDTLIVGTWAKGMYRSFNRGQNWVQVNNGLDYKNINTVISISNGNILIGTNGGGIYKSSNWGESWLPSNNGIPPNSDGYSYTYSLNEITPSYILAGAHNGIYLSTNNGNSWTYKSNGYQNKRANVILSKTNGNIYLGTQLNGGVYWSSNGGISWDPLGLNYTTIFTLGLDNESNLYAGAPNSGLYEFNDMDSSWSRIYNRGYTPIRIDYLNLGTNGMLISKAYFGSLYLKIDKEHDWQNLNFNGYHSEIINDSTIITANYSNIYVSNDTGKTWQNTGNYDVRSTFYDAASNLMYIGTAISFPNNTYGIYYSSDFGMSWLMLHIFENYSEGNWVNSVYVTRSHQYILASVIYGDRFGSSSKLFRSTDKGVTWEDFDLYADEIIEDSFGNIFAMNIDDQLLLSTNEGETWTTKNLPNSNCLAADNRGLIYLGAYNGVKYSTDLGNNWISIDNSGLQSTKVKDMVISKTNQIYIATEKGVYVGNLGNIILSAENQNQSISFTLYQNYPNPFNPSTSIQYAISSRQFVSLKVYDVLGNEVATLVNEELSQGKYEVEYNVSNLSSGIYFYRLNAGSYSSTKKMLLVK